MVIAVIRAVVLFVAVTAMSWAGGAAALVAVLQLEANGQVSTRELTLAVVWPTPFFVVVAAVVLWPASTLLARIVTERRELLAFPAAGVIGGLVATALFALFWNSSPFTSEGWLFALFFCLASVLFTATYGFIHGSRQPEP